MTLQWWEVALLVAAGVVGGLAGSIAGLASVAGVALGRRVYAVGGAVRPSVLGVSAVTEAFLPG